MSRLGPIRRAWGCFGRVAARRAWVALGLAVATFIGCVVVDLVRGGDPNPEIHDEYAYLLAGDTFAHGRLTNPPHELWRSFETFHVLQRPTYQAKYPPAQGLFLALGEVLTGRPIVGVWISDALLVGCLCWMLQAWIPARWAAVGTVIGGGLMVFGGAPLAGGVVGYWSQSYWGGAVAAWGGVLLLGGLRRVLVRPRWGHAAAMGLGVCVLALSRPFEGLVLALPCAAVFAWWLVLRGAVPYRDKVVRAVVPGAAVVLLGLGWLGLYNARVTGSPWRMPYMAYREQYQILPIWRWQEVREEPAGLNDQMRAYAHWELAAGMEQRKVPRRALDMFRVLSFEVGPVLGAVSLLALPWTLRRRWMMFAGAAWGLVWVGMWAGSYIEVHYHAPAAGLSVLLAMAGLRRVAYWRAGRRRVGAAVAAGLVVLMLGVQVRRWVDYAGMPERYLEHWAGVRREVEDSLVRMGGKHVVLVRYGAEHGTDFELVYNAADVDDSPVVWARSLGAEQDGKVVGYYAGRSVWVLTVMSDRAAPVMRPWQPQGRPGN